MMSARKHIIGVCGGIGSGKSTVASVLARFGCAVIDADAICHDLLDYPDIIKQIRDGFGPETLDTAGRINRSALANIVFNDPAKLKQLNDLLHPQIARQEQKQIEACQSDPQIKAIVLDVPLLFETGQNAWCDAIIFVESDEKNRRDRIQKAKHWNEKTLKNIENLQISLDNKSQMSDYSVVNNSGIPGLSVQVATILSKILESDLKAL